ncbi:hypothetical protein AI2719V1_0921 [Enterobacter cloacae]|nr:hypothetical protein AI2984V2_1043 [Enterobacter cloacae]CAH3457566.1 hypothetical protein AI2719V1_0921 [Enterobacter cloacae]CAH5564932.1 hypothetical protein AI2984V2_1043 [Enterobacter cloacae]
MVDVMHYVVIKKHAIDHAHLGKVRISGEILLG